MEAESARLAGLRDRLQAKLLAGLEHIRVNGSQTIACPAIST